jgi:iron complex outermembrane receptor protein
MRSLRAPRAVLTGGLLAAALAAVQPGASSFAQTQGTSALASTTTGAFEEITVTARKREESIERVPIAITAFTQADLTQANVVTLADLRYVTPGLSAQPDTFRQDTLNITIRGLRNFPSDGIQFDTATAVYVDGVYYARTQGLTATLFDIADLEVLKGPQGTLVGRDSEGGAVLYTTREPASEFGGYVNGTIGSYGQRDAQAVVNIPISSKISTRVALSYSESAGYLKNIYYDPATGDRNTTPGMGYRKPAGRFALKYEGREGFKLILRGDIGSEHDTGVSYHDIGTFVGTVPSLGRPSICNIPGTCNGFVDMQGNFIAPYYSNVAAGTINTNPAAYNASLNSVVREASDFWSIDQAVSNRDVDHVHTISATAEQDLGSARIKLLGAYHWFDTQGISASRGNPYDTAQYDYFNPDYKSVTSELNAAGKALHDNLDWTTGLFFFQESVAAQGYLFYLYSPNAPQPAPVTGQQITLTNTTSDSGHNESYAVYNQGTYSVSPRLRLTAGIRYTIDDRFAHLDQTNTRFPATAASTATIPGGMFLSGPYTFNGLVYNGATENCALTAASGNGPLPLDACAFNVSRTFRRATWNVAADYDLFENTLLYLTARTGYRAGAINTGATKTNAALTVAKPETVQDYELGLKSEWQAGPVPVRSNLATYLTNYHDLQVQVALPDAALATGPGGAPCTEAIYLSGGCVGLTTDQVTVNAKAARIYGGEWELSAKPEHHLDLVWNGSYLHAIYTNFTFPIPPGYLQPATTNLSGTSFPLPRWEMNARALVTFTGEELGVAPLGHLTFGADWYWQGRYYTSLVGYSPAQAVKGYSFTGLSLAADHWRDTAVGLRLFVTNLFDKAACLAEPGGTNGGAGVLNSNPTATFGVPGTSGVVQCVPLPPREFGATLSYQF